MDNGQGLTEQDLLDAAISVLQGRLPATWSVEKVSIGADSEPRNLIVKSPNTQSSAILVEARSEVSARDIRVLFGGPWKRWRPQTGNQPILLIARYIGPRVREMLIEDSISYLDLTGNMRIALDYPGIFIEAKGAERDPTSTKQRRGLRGAKVGALVRVLVDAAPPYTGADIARAANVNEGYTSRILDTLVDEGLIERERAGPVTAADWPGLVRRRAAAVDLLRQAGALSFIARRGARQLLDMFVAKPPDPMPAITGSFAAVRLAPVAGPALLVMYTMKSPRDVATEFDLLPSEAGADTVLIRPDNNVVFQRARMADGLLWAAPSQVAIDCLSGNGRMPVEGEAVIGWMRDNENRSVDDGGWRYPSIEALVAASRVQG